MESPPSRPAQVVLVRSEKSIGIAYALLVFLGQIGIHRFYVNRVPTGIAQALLGCLGWGTAWAVIGIFFLVPLWIWLLFDLFLLPGMVRKANAV